MAKPIDDQPAWAITCFYIDRAHRRQGMMAALVRAATRYARDQRARLVEACPVEKLGSDAWGSAFVGVASCFRAEGFKEGARRTPNRPLMRKVL